MEYNEQNLITIAKRDHNKKRTFLLVNPLQGKHLPVSPSAADELFQTLGAKVFAGASASENTIIMGFAGTATAIGAALAGCAPFATRYIHTTREPIPNRQYLFFSESHSHATEQKLIKDFLDQELTADTHIIFAEDEVTTGNPIQNILSLIQNTYPHVRLSFSISSLLNGMPAERVAQLKEAVVDCH